MALGRKTGGRAKGSPNKVTAAKAVAIAASGLTPLDFMLAVLRDEARDHVERMDAAKSAAPYVHARLAAVELETGDGLRSMLAEIIAARRSKIAGLNDGQ